MKKKIVKISSIGLSAVLALSSVSAIKAVSVDSSTVLSNNSTSNQKAIVDAKGAVSIPDTNLAKALQDKLGEITTEKLASMKGELDLSNKGIANIAGLEHCTGITGLILDTNKITDLTPLSGLTNLNKLSAKENQISDSTPLTSLINLRYLDLGNNAITGVNGIAGLTNLTHLDLSNNKITDISKLEGLINLNNLYLNSDDKNHNQISDITALEKMTKITTLKLDNNNISNISPLSKLTSLGTVYINHNQISDLTPLNGLVNIKNLYANHNQIKDISPISTLNQLNILQMTNNQISDLTPISALTSITILDLSSNQISDISKLANLTNVKRLFIGNNQISDITALENLMALEDLHLNNNKISNITALESLYRLGNVKLNDNQITDIRPLKDLKGIVLLDLNNNKIKDFSPLEQLRLTDVNISTQTITLPAINAIDGQVSIKNPLKYTNTAHLDLTNAEISDGGKYDATSNTIQWTGLTSDVNATINLTQTIEIGKKHKEAQISIVVTQPINLVHSITLNSGANGTTTIESADGKPVEFAKEGDVIKVNTTASEGFEVAEIIVKDINGNLITVDMQNNTFVMPKGGVTVDVVYSKIQPKQVIIDSNIINGTITTDKATANTDELVTITVTPNQGYVLKAGSLKATTASGLDVAITEITRMANGNYSFVMPRENVTITAQFEAIPTTQPTPPAQQQTGKNPITGTAGAAALLGSSAIAGLLAMITRKRKNK